MNEAAVTSFWSFVAERQRIWYRRHVLQQPRPWTSDPILRDRHFTNVYRQLDPGSEFAQKCIAQLHDRRDVVWFTIAYRLVNRAQTVREFRPVLHTEGDFEIPTRTDAEAWLQYLDQMHRDRVTYSTSRHITPNRKQVAACLRRAIDLELSSDPVVAMKQLRSLPGIGRFTGWLVHCDLVVAGIVDYDPDLVVIGDGCALGVAVISGARDGFSGYLHDGRRRVREGEVKRVRASDSDNEVYARWVRWLRDWQFAELEQVPDWSTISRGPLTVVDVEHALCEWARWGVYSSKVD